MDTPAIKDIKTPFTPYDVLAYLIPGLTCVSAIAYYEFVLAQHVPPDKLHAPFQHVGQWVETLHCGQDSGSSWAIQFLALLGVVTALYVVGHIIASLSELCLDRFMLHKATGYPREKLLELHDKQGRDISRPFYRGTFFWINLAALLCYGQVLCPKYEAWLINGVWFITGGVVVGFVFKIMASGLTAPQCAFEICFRKTLLWRAWKALFMFLLTWVYAGPIRLIGKFYNDIVQPQRGFDEEFRRIFKAKFRTLFAMDAEKAQSNVYWLPYIYIAEKSEILNKVLINWLNLYGLMRNLSMAFYLAFIYTTVSLSFEGHNLPEKEGLCAKYLPLALFALSMISLLRFYYLYSAYYTKFLYRAFVFLVTQAETDKAPHSEKMLLTRRHVFGRLRRN